MLHIQTIQNKWFGNSLELQHKSSIRIFWHLRDRSLDFRAGVGNFFVRAIFYRAKMCRIFFRYD